MALAYPVLGQIHSNSHQPMEPFLQEDQEDLAAAACLDGQLQEVQRLLSIDHTLQVPLSRLLGHLAYQALLLPCLSGQALQAPLLQHTGHLHLTQDSLPQLQMVCQEHGPQVRGDLPLELVL